MNKLWAVTLLVALYMPILLHADPSAILIKNAYIVEAPPGMHKQAAYLEIENSGTQTMVLMAARCPAFARVEIHQTRIQDGIAMMESVDEITILPQQSFAFTRGNYHFMLIKPHAPLSAGDSVPLTLIFNDGQETTIPIEIIRR